MTTQNIQGTPDNSQSPKRETMFDFVLKALPLFTVILIFLGISNAIVFYKIFRINIVQFISLSESALFSLDYIILYGFIHYFIAIFLFLKASKLADGTEEDKRKLLIYKYGLESIMWLLGCYFILKTSFCESKLSNHLAFTYCADLAGIGGIMWANGFYKKSINRINRYFIISVLFLAIVIVNISARSALTKKYTSDINNTIITLKDTGDIVKTNDTLIYVGKVEKYYLLYNRIVETGMVINVDDVKKIQWSKNDSMRSDSFIDSLVMHKFK